MKKYVLSAIVTGLLVPSAYAMDGAAPPVEVEVPVVETPAIEHEAVVVDHVATAVEDVKVEVVDVAPGDTGVVETHHMGVLTFRQDVAEGVPFDPDTQPKEYAEWVAEHPTVDQTMIDLASQSGVAVDDNGNPIHIMNFGGLAHDGEVATITGVDPLPADPNAVDFAAHGGLVVDENGNPVLHAIDLIYVVDENGKIRSSGPPNQTVTRRPNRASRSSLLPARGAEVTARCASGPCWRPRCCAC